MITTRSLSKTYGFGTRKVEAVRGIDLEVRRGEIFGLVGPDGSGKTTTIQMLCGILKPSSGSANVAGVDVVNNPMAWEERSAIYPKALHSTARLVLVYK